MHILVARGSNMPYELSLALLGLDLLECKDVA